MKALKPVAPALPGRRKDAGGDAGATCVVATLGIPE